MKGKIFASGVMAFAASFFADTRRRRLFYLVFLGIFALADFFVSGLVRRTFVFYSINKGTIVEERLLARSPSPETAVRRYIEEALLGPVSLDTAPLFDRETRLESLLYRDGAVYADLSGIAALPLPEGGSVPEGLSVLRGGILRNFPRVKDVKLFIGGNETFFENFVEL